MVIFSSLIFLNFIIAEVSASYQKVKDSVNQIVYQERSGLVDEAEDMMPKMLMNENRVPEFIVMRCKDN